MTDTAPLPASLPTAKAERSSYLGVFAVTLSLLAIAATGYTLEQFRHLQSRPQPASDDRVNLAIQQRKIARLEQSLLSVQRDISAIQASLTQREEAPVDTTEDIASLKQSLEDVRAELAAGQEAVSSDLAQFDKKLSSQHSSEQQVNTRIAYEQLRSRVESGRPYEAALDVLRTASPEAAESQPFAVLDAHKLDGIKTLSTLYGELVTITRAPVEAPGPQPEKEAETDGWKKAFASLGSLVRIERIADDASPSVSLAQAEIAMKFGDVREAREAVRHLPEQDQRAFESWLDDSKARLDVVEALQSLAPTVIAAPAPEQPEAPASPSGTEE